jgi:hypothetical protein
LEDGKVLCRFEQCCKAVSSNNAAKHERTHTGERPYECDAPGCGAAFTRQHHLAHHQRTHTGERPFHCEVPGCSESFKVQTDLRRHTMVHNNNRPYVCTAEGCEARYVKANDLKMHVERNHTERAHQRRKKREEQLYKYLTSVGYAPDRETVVQFCGEGSKKLARLDFTIYKPDRVVVVECDEREHSSEAVLCEVTRMLDVAAQHRLRSDLPLHFIRFNPDGYKVDGMAEMHKELLLAIEEPVSAPLAMSYICYSSSAGAADVTKSEEFPPDLREACKTRLA